MKAKEYYEKYCGDLVAEWRLYPLEGETLSLTVLITEFIKETVEIMRIRKCVKLDATQAVVLEQNDKWNAIVRIFDKKAEESPLKRDGFLHYAEKNLPQLFPDKPIPKEYPLPQPKKETPQEQPKKEKEFKNAKFV